MGLCMVMATVVIPDMMAVADADFAMINDDLSWLRNLHLLLPDTTDHMIDNFHNHNCFVGFTVVAKIDLDRNIIDQADGTVATGSSFG